MTRFDRMPPLAQMILRIASVIGDRWDPGTVARLHAAVTSAEAWDGSLINDEIAMMERVGPSSTTTILGRFQASLPYSNDMFACSTHQRRLTLWRPTAMHTATSCAYF